MAKKYGLLVSLAVMGLAWAAPRPPVKKAPPRPAPRKPPPAVRKPMAPAPKPTSSVAARATPPETPIYGPINVRALAGEGRAVLTASPGTDGETGAVFDGNRHTACEATPDAGGVAFWQVRLDKPRPVETCDVLLPEGRKQQWAFYGADSEADMAARGGSYAVLSSFRNPQYPDRDQARFVRPRAYRVFRLECRTTGAGDRPAVAEWALWSPQQITRLLVDTFQPTVVPGELIQLRATALLDAGAELNVTPEVAWEVTPATAGTIDPLQRFQARTAGPARVIASHGKQRSGPLGIEVLPEGQPDWTVTYIELQPRLNFGSGDAALKPGQLVYWFAHVKNYGTADALPTGFEWRVDGEIITQGKLPKLERFQQTDVVAAWRWEPGRHVMELAVDPANEAAETSEANNRLRVYSNAEPVGFWVEDSIIRYFHRHQRDLGIGSNCWEDWAQRQIAFWNRWMEGGAWLWSTPEIKARRYRLDRVAIVGDGMLPMSPGDPLSAPDSRDQTVRLALGMPSEQQHLYRRTREAVPGNPFLQQSSYLWDLPRIRAAGTGANHDAGKSKARARDGMNPAAPLALRGARTGTARGPVASLPGKVACLP